MPDVTITPLWRERAHVTATSPKGFGWIARQMKMGADQTVTAEAVPELAASMRAAGLEVEIK